MADISKEIEAWRSARYGKDVRQAQIDLSNKLNTEVEQGTQTIHNYTAAESARVEAEAARVQAEAERVEEFEQLKAESQAATEAANEAAEAIEGAVEGVINDSQVSSVTTYSSSKLEQTYVSQQDRITNMEIDALDDDISDVPDGENVLLQIAEKVENKADNMSFSDGFLQLESEGRKIGSAVSLPEGGGGSGPSIEVISDSEIEDMFKEV